MDIDSLNRIKAETIKFRNYTTRSIGILLLSLFVLITLTILTMNKFKNIFPIAAPILGIIVAGSGISSIVMLITYNKNAKEYRHAYKMYFSGKTLEKILDKYIYYPELGIDKSTLGSLNCIRFGNRYRSEDLVVGEHKNVRICQADLTIRHESSDEKYTETYFNGRWIIAVYPKKFESKLIIVSKSLSKLIIPPAGLKKAEVESIEFNNKFDIYTKDGREMLYLLDPRIIDRMQTLAEKCLDYIVFIFDNQKLHIGLNAADSFEPLRTDAPLDEAKEIERLSKDTRLIADLIDEFGLDRRRYS